MFYFTAWIYDTPRTKEAYTEMQAQIERAKKWHAEKPSKLVAVKSGDKIVVSQKPAYRDGMVQQTRKEPLCFEAREGDACMLERADGIDRFLKPQDDCGNAPNLALMMVALYGVDYESLPTMAQCFNRALGDVIAADKWVQK